MSKKSLLRMLGILLVVSIGVLAVIECRPGTATAFNFWRVAEGMSQADVESILGPGAGLNPGEPATLAGHCELPPVRAFSLAEVAKALGDPQRGRELEGLLAKARDGIATPLFEWCDEHLGAGLAVGHDAQDGVLLDLARLQSYCGGRRR